MQDETNVLLGNRRRQAAAIQLPPKVELLKGRVGGVPALELALAQALLEAVARGELGPAIRSYRPPATVAFGRRDALLPGFRHAAAAAHAHGFAPVLRAPGGQAAAYDDGCVVIDEIMPSRDPTKGTMDRFADRAERQAEALRRLGVDARVGQVPGEYCPGAFSVNSLGKTKLIGAAQRVVRGGWLFSTIVIVESAERIRAVLEDVYAAFGKGWDPVTVGSVAQEAPGVTIDVVEEALLDIYARRYRLAPGGVPSSAIAAAVMRIGRHLVDPPRGVGRLC
jgi:lipoate-protein ligase A